MDIDAELLTKTELEAVKALADAYGLVVATIGKGPSRSRDVAEVALHIHNLQHFVMAQAAARAYPDLFRLAGETVGAPN